MNDVNLPIATASLYSDFQDTLAAINFIDEGESVKLLYLQGLVCARSQVQCLLQNLFLLLQNKYLYINNMYCKKERFRVP